MSRHPVTLFCAFLCACSREAPERTRARSSQSDTVAAGAMATLTHSNPPSTPSCSQGVSALCISEDGIGPLDFSMTIATMRAAFPASQDTVLYGEENVSGGVRFTFPGLIVLAGQYEDSLIPRLPADWMSVSSPNGLLFGRVALSAPWATFRDAFSPGIASGENASTDEHRVTVMFCAHPRVLLILDASPDSVTSSRPADLSRIPPDTRITEVDVFARSNATWHC